MTNPGGLPEKLSDAVAAYVSWRGREHPVSLRRLVKDTSYMMPELGLTERELSDLLAAKLVALGCNINFDMSEAVSSLPDDEKRQTRTRRQTPIDHGTPRSAR